MPRIVPVYISSINGVPINYIYGLNTNRVDTTTGIIYGLGQYPMLLYRINTSDKNVLNIALGESSSMFYREEEVAPAAKVLSLTTKNGTIVLVNTSDIIHCRPDEKDYEYSHVYVASGSQATQYKFKISFAALIQRADSIRDVAETFWEDLRFPFVGEQLDTSSGRIDYNYTECTVDYATNARFSNEPVCFVCHMPHAKLLGSNVRPHLHWKQAANVMPNWMISYRWYNNGDNPADFAFTGAKYSGNVLAWPGTHLMQITMFPELTPPPNESLSSILDVRLYRDSANTSGMFDGADAYPAAAQAKEFDLHYQLDLFGSTSEYVK